MLQKAKCDVSITEGLKEGKSILRQEIDYRILDNHAFLCLEIRNFLCNCIFLRSFFGGLNEKLSTLFF